MVFCWPAKNGRPALSPARPRKGRAFGGVSIQRKTELGRDLQRRADACQGLADHLDRDIGGQPDDVYWVRLRAACEGKAQAYAHAAELADAEGAK
jgi:hypothetical protein